ncbi:hypothetical protein C8A01DRAFT_36677 [Parachaetomium inaequale]|uniref:MalT-like TPR region domain-containing protein n=1 Tax=Parachaetomium inaequale TaxID=2588326 RepID=A0AAN6SRA1_9PEZI|nr:hypothetical protein C8A01DRAFT_36677 [Parachaetomium inaequale]
MIANTSGYFITGLFYRLQNDFESAERYYLEAQNAWLTGDQTRLHPFNGGCMYNLGVSCLLQGKVEAAIKHLRDSLEVTRFYRNSRPAEHAHNLFKLSEALLQDAHDGSAEEASALWDEAQRYLKMRDPDAAEGSTDSVYNSLVSINWR